MFTIFERNVFIQYLAVGFVSLNVFNSGMVYGWPSAFLPELQDTQNDFVKFHITSAQGSWVAIGSLLGVLVGAPFATYNLDDVGRKRIILFSVLPYLSSWILIATANSFGLLLLARFLAGISDGIIYTSVPMYIGEIASPEIRGMLGSTFEISVLGGVIAVNLLGMIFTVATSAIIAALVPVISFFCLLSMPESPYFLLMKNQIIEAESALQFLRGSEDVDRELNGMNSEVRLELEQSKGSLKDLFTVPANRKSLLIVLLLRGTQQLAGIKAFIFYLPMILTEGGSNSPITTVLGFVILLFSAILGAYFVDYVGRRKLLLLSLTGTITALILEGMCFQIQILGDSNIMISVILVFAVLIFVTFYGFGVDIVPMVMISELFSTNTKSISNCIEEVYAVILGASVTKFFEVMDTAGIVYVAFYFFSSCSMISFILIYIYVPETKGRTLEEIQFMLKSRKKQRSGSVEE